jgi:hypothetical protein
MSKNWNIYFGLKWIKRLLFATIENKIKENTGVNASFSTINLLTIHRVNIRIQIEQTEISLCIFVF